MVNSDNMKNCSTCLRLL